MFGWFRSKSECPVEPVARDWIDARWSWLAVAILSSRLERHLGVQPGQATWPTGTPKAGS